MDHFNVWTVKQSFVSHKSGHSRLLKNNWGAVSVGIRLKGKKLEYNYHLINSSWVASSKQPPPVVPSPSCCTHRAIVEWWRRNFWPYFQKKSPRYLPHVFRPKRSRTRGYVITSNSGIYLRSSIHIWVWLLCGCKKKSGMKWVAFWWGVYSTGHSIIMQGAIWRKLQPKWCRSQIMTRGLLMGEFKGEKDDWKKKKQEQVLESRASMEGGNLPPPPSIPHTSPHWPIEVRVWFLIGPTRGPFRSVSDVNLCVGLQKFSIVNQLRGG